MKENPEDFSLMETNNADLSLPAKIVPPLLESPQKMPPKRHRTFFWGTALFIFLIGYGINWLRVSLFSSLSGCGMMPEELVGEYQVSAINYAQKNYFSENQTFAKDLQELKVDFSSQKNNYSYSIRTTKQAVFSYAIPNADAYKLRTEYFGPFWWDFKDSLPFKSSTGAVFVVPTNNIDSKSKQKKMITVSIVCNSLRPGAAKLTEPKLVKGVPTCGAGTKEGVR